MRVGDGNGKGKGKLGFLVLVMVTVLWGVGLFWGYCFFAGGFGVLGMLLGRFWVLAGWVVAVGVWCIENSQGGSCSVSTLCGKLATRLQVEQPVIKRRREEVRWWKVCCCCCCCCYTRAAMYGKETLCLSQRHKIARLRVLLSPFLLLVYSATASSFLELHAFSVFRFLIPPNLFNASGLFGAFRFFVAIVSLCPQCALHVLLIIFS